MFARQGPFSLSSPELTYRLVIVDQPQDHVPDFVSTPLLALLALLALPYMLLANTRSVELLQMYGAGCL